MRNLIDKLISEKGRWQEKTDGDTAKPDAVWGDTLRLIFELKNEDGLYGNASTQATIVYGKIIAQSKVRHAVYTC